VIGIIFIDAITTKTIGAFCFIKIATTIRMIDKPVYASRCYRQSRSFVSNERQRRSILLLAWNFPREITKVVVSQC